MQLLRISEKEYLKIKGSPMTPFFYANEFNRNIFQDVVEAFNDGYIINTLLSNQIAWAMAKTADLNILDYNLWITFIDVKYSALWGSVLDYSCTKWLDIEISSEDEKSTTVTKESDPIQDAINTLISAKRMGLSFEELNMISMNNYVNFISEYVSDDKPKKATQEDIDRYFS